MAHAAVIAVPAAALAPVATVAAEAAFAGAATVAAVIVVFDALAAGFIPGVGFLGAGGVEGDGQHGGGEKKRQIFSHLDLLCQLW
jgi:hypothetical protein